MATKAQLEQRLASLEGELRRCRHDRDLLASKFLTVEQILFSLPTEVPRRTNGETYDYIDSRRHLIEQIKAAIS